MSWNNYNFSSNYNKNNDIKYNKSLSSKRYNNIIEDNIISNKSPNSFNYQNQSNNINNNRFYSNNINNNYNNNILYRDINTIKEEKDENTLSHSWDHIYNRKIEPMGENLNNLNIFTINSNPKGLDNIGATCYMNATLQCFYHCKKLTKYFLDNKHLQDGINIKNNTITAEYINLVKELSKKDGKSSYAPYRFKEILSRENPLFKGIAANDSKDLILFLEQVLHRELTVPDKNKIIKRIKSYELIDQTNENNVFNLFMEDFKEERSIMKDLFYFICKTKSNCLVCKTIVYNLLII